MASSSYSAGHKVQLKVLKCTRNLTTLLGIKLSTSFFYFILDCSISQLEFSEVCTHKYCGPLKTLSTLFNKHNGTYFNTLFIFSVKMAKIRLFVFFTTFLLNCFLSLLFYYIFCWCYLVAFLRKICSFFVYLIMKSWLLNLSRRLDFKGRNYAPFCFISSK